MYMCSIYVMCVSGVSHLWCPGGRRVLPPISEHLSGFLPLRCSGVRVGHRGDGVSSTDLKLTEFLRHKPKVLLCVFSGFFLGIVVNLRTKKTTGKSQGS